MGAEALRLRAKAEGWAKPVGMVGKAQSKVGKSKYADEKAKHGKDGPSLGHDDFELVDKPEPLRKSEHKNDSTLTPKEERFVGEYLIDLNATQAAIRLWLQRQAGTSDRSGEPVKTVHRCRHRRSSGRTGKAH